MHAFECLVKSNQKVWHCHKRVYIRVEAYIYIEGIRGGWGKLLLMTHGYAC